MVPQRPLSAHARIQSPLPIVIAPQQTQLPTSSSIIMSSNIPSSLNISDDGIEVGGDEEVVQEQGIEDEEQLKIQFELKDDDLKGRVRMKLTPVSQHLQPNSSSLSSSPQKSTAIEHFHAFSDTTALSRQSTDSLSSRTRKGSEPPPSLMALFEGNVKKTHKQQSYEEESVHAKQHSFDNSNLTTSQSQGSPRHRRRMRSPVLSDVDTDKTMCRTPSQPHLITSTPHLTLIKQPLTKAHSIQQLRAESPGDHKETRNHRSSSGGNEQLLKPQKKQDHHLSSKESSNTSSVASLKVKDDIERTSTKVTNRRLMSVDSVPMRSAAKSSLDMWRRNSSQLGTSIRGDVVSSKRPYSMVETSSTIRTHYSIGEFNPTPSTLVAQMFWTAVSLLESDFEAEFSMALRLISKVYCY